MDADVCAGPYDVVIQRKTLQFFPPARYLANEVRGNFAGRLR
jgi:hypothetical protein